MNFPRQMGRTSFTMMTQITTIWKELLLNPKCKILVYSMNKEYFENLINFAKHYNLDLKMSIPSKDKDVYSSLVISMSVFE